MCTYKLFNAMSAIHPLVTTPGAKCHRQDHVWYQKIWLLINQYYSLLYYLIITKLLVIKGYFISLFYFVTLVVHRGKTKASIFVSVQTKKNVLARRTNFVCWPFHSSKHEAAVWSPSICLSGVMLFLKQYMTAMLLLISGSCHVGSIGCWTV